MARTPSNVPVQKEIDLPPLSIEDCIYMLSESITQVENMLVIAKTQLGKLHKLPAEHYTFEVENITVRFPATIKAYLKI